MKPQQANVKGLDNLPSGTIDWDMPGGHHRVRYRRLDDVALQPVRCSSQDEAYEVFCKYLADLRAAVAVRPQTPGQNPKTEW